MCEFIAYSVKLSQMFASLNDKVFFARRLERRVETGRFRTGQSIRDPGEMLLGGSRNVMVPSTGRSLWGKVVHNVHRHVERRLYICW